MKFNRSFSNDAINGDQFDEDAAQGLITQLWGPQLMANNAKQMDFKSVKDYQQWLKRMQGFPTFAPHPLKYQ